MGEILYAGSIHKVEQAKIDAARLTQKARNERSAAESDLQRFSAMLGNRRRMDAAGKQIENINRAIAKNIDAKVSGDLNGQIRIAEELGANTTMAAAAGVGGSSVEAYNDTVRLRAAMAQEQTDRAFNSDLIAAGEDKGTTLTNAVAGLDNNVYMASMDRRVFVDHKKMGPFERVWTIGAAAAATYFGGPQAGQAVLSLSSARQAARNGDFGTASQQFDNSIKSAVGSYKQSRDVGWDRDGFFNERPAPVPQVPQINVTPMERYDPYRYSNFGASFKG